MVAFPGAAPAARPRTLASCSSCCLQGVCLPRAIASNRLSELDELTIMKRRIARGAFLYRSGDEFDAVYAVRSGALKTLGVSSHGVEKITGFYLPGEVMGLDAINSARRSVTMRVKRSSVSGDSTGGSISRQVSASSGAGTVTLSEVLRAYPVSAARVCDMRASAAPIR